MADWVPPEPLVQRAPHLVKGALNGSLILEQPRYRAEVERLQAFLEAPGPVALEVGVDHGTVLIAHARERQDWRWIGLDVRRRKIAKAAPHAPDNALLWAADARTVFALALPEARLDRIDILFPTPVTNPRHVLFTPGFIADLRRALRPGGVVTVASDVPGLFSWIAEGFADWEAAEAPWRGEVRSRRERVCRRDGIPVQWGHWR